MPVKRELILPGLKENSDEFYTEPFCLWNFYVILFNCNKCYCVETGFALLYCRTAAPWLFLCTCTVYSPSYKSCLMYRNKLVLSLPSPLSTTVLLKATPQIVRFHTVLCNYLNLPFPPAHRVPSRWVPCCFFNNLFQPSSSSKAWCRPFKTLFRLGRRFYNLDRSYWSASLFRPFLFIRPALNVIVWWGLRLFWPVMFARVAFYHSFTSGLSFYVDIWRLCVYVCLLYILKLSL